MIVTFTLRQGRAREGFRFARRFAVAAGVSLLAAAPALHAAEYPARPVRLIAPFSAGGGADTVARLFAERLSDTLGKQFVVDNRPGASNIIGTDLAAKAAPDGHTILLVINNHVINAGLFPKLPYDTGKDFTPISLIGLNPFILVVNPSLPVRSVQDLIGLARSKPGALNFASAGNGTAAHLAAALFDVKAKVKMTHVPYKGISQAVIDVVAGNVQVLFPSPASALTQVKSGRLRLLAVTTRERLRSLPDVPTIAESGVPGYEFSNWWGLLAPSGTPRAIVARLNQEVTRALKHPAVQARLSALGGEPIGSTPEYFRDYLEAETAKYAQLIREAGIRIR